MTPPATHHTRALKVATLAVGLAFAGATLATPASADTTGDSFLSALNDAGIGYTNPVDTVALGQSICPMLVEPGKSFASAVSRVRDNGISPDIAAFFAGIAIQMYCPSMVSSIADGSVLNQLSGLSGLGGLNGLTGVSALPGLSGFGVPGL